MRLDLLRCRAARRLVHVSAADLDLSARHRHGHLALGLLVHRDRRDRRRGRNDHRCAQDPPPGDAHQSHAALCLLRTGRGGDDPVRLSPAHCREHAHGSRARLSLAVLQSRGRRRSPPLAASLPAFRPPGGVHHLPSIGRADCDDRTDFRAAAHCRLRVDRAGGGGRGIFELRALGAPHVYDRVAGHFARVVLGGLGGCGDPDRGANLLLHRNDRGRARGALGADALPSAAWRSSCWAA